MAAPKSYEITAKGAMQWAAAELEHVGRIASVMDPDIQYAYAMSTLNGMAHLKDALFELVNDPAYEHHREDLQRTHDAVVRTMKHLKREYGLDLDAIRAFNTRGTLSDLTYLEDEVSVAPEAPMEYPTESVTPANFPQDGGMRRRSNRSRRRQSRSRRSCRSSNRSNRSNRSTRRR